MDFVITNYAEKRMERYGLKRGHIEYIIKYTASSYKTHGDTVHKSDLPDGRTIKVRIRQASQIEIVDAFQVIGG